MKSSKLMHKSYNGSEWAFAVFTSCKTLRSYLTGIQIKAQCYEEM